MKKETLYYFTPSELSSRLLNELLQLEATGDHLGFTYPKRNTHTCFNSQQEAKLTRIVEPYVARGLNFERAPYYRGNLSGDDFGITTIQQPLVQWCPVPIASARYRRVFDNAEPWGLATDGQILLAKNMRSLISREIHGLERNELDVYEMFDWYKMIANDSKSSVDAAFQDRPLSIDSNAIIKGADIWKLASGVILCSQRFAKLLDRFWDGFPDVKFQPVICRGLSAEAERLLMKPISIKEMRRNLHKERNAIESALGVTLPEKYVAFLEEHPTKLPLGWLSIDGGVNSELMKVMKTEHEDAEPAMPPSLIPILAYENGDYLCFQKGVSREDDLKVVDWLHDGGLVDDEVDEPW